MTSEITPEVLARKAIEKYITEGIILTASEFKVINVNNKKAGVYISIKLLDGSLRGCRGSKYPTKETIEEEIIANTISTATTDKRFPPIKPEELKNICITVHILHEPELIYDINTLNPEVYGIIIRSDSDKTGILLPGARNIKNSQIQIQAAREKAKIDSTENVQIYRFKTDKYSEK